MKAPDNITTLVYSPTHGIQGMRRAVLVWIVVSGAAQEVSGKTSLSDDFLWCHFLSRQTMGNMSPLASHLSYVSAADGLGAIELAPGSAPLLVQCTVATQWSQAYLLVEAAPKTDAVGYMRVSVNERTVQVFGYDVSQFETVGFEATDYLQEGHNTVAIAAEPSGGPLLIRGMVLGPSTSVTQVSQGLPSPATRLVVRLLSALVVMIAAWIVAYRLERRIGGGRDFLTIARGLQVLVMSGVLTGLSILLAPELVFECLRWLAVWCLLVLIALVGSRRRTPRTGVS